MLAKKKKQVKYNSKGLKYEYGEEPLTMIKQNSSYREGNKCAPDNNIFFEELSNPLGSKGN